MFLTAYLLIANPILLLCIVMYLHKRFPESIELCTPGVDIHLGEGEGESESAAEGEGEGEGESKGEGEDLGLG